jgi:hypothetical protein
LADNPLKFKMVALRIVFWFSHSIL